MIYSKSFTVRKFIATEFDCFYTATQKGGKAGIIDVLGIRNSIGDFGGHSELISMEVKPEKNTFLKSLGQAYAYSIMAEHCYLAVYKPKSDFTREEKRSGPKAGRWSDKDKLKKEMRHCFKLPGT